MIKKIKEAMFSFNIIKKTNSKSERDQGNHGFRAFHFLSDMS